MLEHLKRYAAFGLIALLIVAVAYGYTRYRSYEGELARLRNEVASRDVTVEELKGTYAKLAREDSELKSSNRDLQRLLDKTKQELVAEQQVSLRWKGKYEYLLSHAPSDAGGFKPPVHQDACTPAPRTYTASQDIGLLKLSIDTYTVDPSYQQRLHIEPGSKPLVLTLDLTRDSAGQWRSHVTSSDERIGVEIGVNSVNVEAFQLRWYERIKLHLDLGAGMNGGGILGGVGIAYQFGKFELGPTLWGTTSGHEFGGLNLSWAPFQRSR